MGLACLFGHKWNGCECERCGEIRDEGHNYTHFKPSSTGKCVGTCKCGKQQELEHDWVGAKCARCGLKWTDTYEYAIRLMDEKNYYDAFKCFERIEQGSCGGSFEDKKKKCFELAYKSVSDAVTRNDYAHIQYQTIFGYGIDEMEDALIEIELRRRIKNHVQIGWNQHPLMDKLKEQICSAILKNIEKKDYQSVQGWLQSLGDHWEDICKTYIRDSDTLNLGIYGAALSCIEKKDYITALRYLRILPEDYPMKSEKMAECEELRQHGRTDSAKLSGMEVQRQQISRKPRSCLQSPDGEHQWETVPGSEVTIDSETRKIGYHMARCRYCGKTEKVIDFDYDTDGY